MHYRHSLSMDSSSSASHTTAPTSAAHAGFRPDIEGLRAIAILLVALYHAGLPFLPGGFIGVDLFFVLSGYLITGLLVKEIERNGTVDFATFYARRARRLIPAAAFMVLVTLGVAQFVYAPQELITLAKDAMTTALYASNLWFAHVSTDYLASDAAKSALLHTWSLSVEEQFYFVWPMFLLIAFRGKRGAAPQRKRLLRAMGVLSLLSLGFSLWLTQVAQPWAFFASPVRAWEFAVGGMACLLPGTWMAARPWLRRAAFWGGVSLILAAALSYDHSTTFPGWAALMPVLGTLLTLISHTPEQNSLGARMLQHPIVQWLGSRSYSWYLWHWPVLVMAKVLYPDFGVVLGLACLSVALVMAEISYRVVETPLRFSPMLSRRPAYSIALALGLTIVTATSAEIWRQIGHREANSPAQLDFTRAMNDIPSTIYNSDCHLSLLETATGDCVFGDPTGTKTVVLFGDSHAAQWFPALETLANEQNWRLVSFTKSACPVAWVLPQNRQLGRAYNECNQWREAIVNKIIALQPAIVVMGYYRYVSLPRAEMDGIRADQWQEGMQQTFKRFDEASIPVAVLRDSLHPGFDVPTCLARKAASPWRNLNCDYSRQPALDSMEYQLTRNAARPFKQVSFIDLSSEICAGDDCSPVDINSGVVLFRDNHHLTTAAVRQMAPQLNTALLAAMVAD